MNVAKIESMFTIMAMAAFRIMAAALRPAAPMATSPNVPPAFCVPAAFGAPEEPFVECEAAESEPLTMFPADETAPIRAPAAAPAGPAAEPEAAAPPPPAAAPPDAAAPPPDAAAPPEAEAAPADAPDEAAPPEADPAVAGALPDAADPAAFPLGAADEGVFDDLSYARTPGASFAPGPLPFSFRRSAYDLMSFAASFMLDRVSGERSTSSSMYVLGIIWPRLPCSRPYLCSSFQASDGS